VRARGLEGVDPYSTNGAEEAGGLEREGEGRQISNLPPELGFPFYLRTLSTYSNPPAIQG